jgi:hypothetical protein
VQGPALWPTLIHTYIHHCCVSSNKGRDHVGPRRRWNSYKPERIIVLFYELEEEEKKKIRKKRNENSEASLR